MGEATPARCFRPILSVETDREFRYTQPIINTGVGRTGSKTMFRFFSLIILVTCLFRAEIGSAQEKKVANQPLPAETTQKPLPLTAEPAKPASYLVPNSDEFVVIYERLIGAKGYPRGLGHATAVARLVNCLAGTKPEDKANLVDQIILNLNSGNQNNLRRRVVNYEIELKRDIRNSPQAAQLAAIFACKMGNRNLEQVLADFDNAFLEVMAKMEKAHGRANTGVTFFQLIAIAELMN